MEIKILRLSSGEDIIAKVELYGTKYRVKDPFYIGVAKANKEGQVDPNTDAMNYTVVMQPYTMPYIKLGSELDIHQSHVIFCAEVDDTLRQKYEARFSNIIIPNMNVNLVK